MSRIALLPAFLLFQSVTAPTEGCTQYTVGTGQDALDETELPRRNCTAEIEATTRSACSAVNAAQRRSHRLGIETNHWAHAVYTNYFDFVGS